MATELQAAPVLDRLSVEISDPTGQEFVELNVRPTAKVSEILAMATTELKVPPNVTFDLRDEATSRLLPPDLTIGEVASDVAPHVRATLQPDAGLA